MSALVDPITNAEGLLVWLQDRAEKLDNDGYFNGANGTRLWADAVNALLTERTVLREALTFYATAEAHEVDSDRGNVASKTLKVSDPMTSLGKFCDACQAIPIHGYCNLAGCPTGRLRDREFWADGCNVMALSEGGGNTIATAVDAEISQTIVDALTTTHPPKTA